MAKSASTTIKKTKKWPESLRDCVGPDDSASPSQGPWRYSILATDTVAYTSGRLARAGDTVRHDVDREELERCRRLADEAVGFYLPSLASEGELVWEPFYVASNRDEPIPGRIDEALIRSRFGGTILPIAPIAVSPIGESGRWWDEISMNIGFCQDFVTQELLKISLEEYMQRSLAAARTLVERGLTRYGTTASFNGSGLRRREQEEAERVLRETLQVPEGERLYNSYTNAARKFLGVMNLARLFEGPDFLDAAFVEIGEDYSREVPKEEAWPPGLESWPSCFPRLLVGLTRGGSLAGVVGSVVAT